MTEQEIKSINNKQTFVLKKNGLFETALSKFDAVTIRILDKSKTVNIYAGKRPNVLFTLKKINVDQAFYSGEVFEYIIIRGESVVISIIRGSDQNKLLEKKDVA